MKILALLLSFALLASGCSHGGPIFPDEEGWVVEQKYVLFFSYSNYYYCRALKSEDGQHVNPVCFEAGMIDSSKPISAGRKSEIAPVPYP